MAWRFKASKYKNAAPIVPKPEACIRDISVGSYQTYGNNISASAAFMAFNVDHNGSSLAVLPIDDCGRKSKTMPLLHAHTDTVTDMDFSPFHDGLLATGSQDCLVKLWRIPEEGLKESLCDPECTFSHKQRRVETVLFHPTADGLLTSTSFTTLTLWDVVAECEVYSNAEHSDVIQSLGWKRDGTLLATSCKDKQVRVVDPRSQVLFTHIANSHQSIKDSRVVWLGDSNRILTTGFNSGRQREVFIRDLRNFEEAEKSLVLDSSTGILIPLYDADTGMLFLAGKGDTTISYLEVTDCEPFLIEGIRHNGDQTKGACLVPKRALVVMQAEVNRLLQLTSTSVIPIMYQVPRKSYRDFHSDLFPDTVGCEAQLAAPQWMEGHNVPVGRISLDPSKMTSMKRLMGWTSHSRKVGLKDENAVHQNGEAMKSTHQNGGANHQSVPPKPLPRASRAGSLTECDEPPVAPRPVARPRTSAPCVVTSVSSSTPIMGGYKQPRLGPKPFTPPKLNFGSSVGDGDLKGTTDFSFDKVFSVPSAPNHEHSLNGNIPKIDNTSFAVDTCDKISITYQDGFSTKEDEHITREDGSPLKEVVGFLEEDFKYGASYVNCEAIADQKNFQRVGQTVLSSVTPSVKPKTPSTAERRKVFEKCSEQDQIFATVDASSKTDELLDDKLGDFERSSIQRTSIAERRRLYENRSVSVQDGSTADKSSPTLSPTPLRRRDSFKMTKPTTSEVVKEEESNKRVDPATTPTPKRTSTVFGRVSKFRHLKGTPMHKSTHIENVRNISRQISGECDGFHANPERVAVPLSGPGGKIAVFELSRPGKLPDGVIPTLVHGTNVMDFMWDPFDFKRLAVACDDGMIRLWAIPEEGLSEPINNPNVFLAGHSEKIYFIKFHPLAKDVLASGSYDMTVRIWDLASQTEKIVLKGHQDQMFSFAWSPCGTMCATACKDGKLRIFKPRSNMHPVREGKGPSGSRGARVVWALEGSFLVVMGFDKVSERQIQAFKSDNLSAPLNTMGLDVSPAILIPFYDEDSSTLFLTGKGDSTIYALEVTEEAPYICPLSHHRCNTLHQGLSFLPKNVCDVSSVEFARALRLTNNTIEPLSFTVPRIKSDLFQDDLFPPTKVTWQPTMSSSQWFQGVDKQSPRISLHPQGMGSLSDVQGSSQQPVTASKATLGSFPGVQQPYNRLGWNSDVSGATKEKQEQIQRAVSSRMEVNLKLEQDEMEGVDEQEWED